MQIINGLGDTLKMSKVGKLKIIACEHYYEKVWGAKTDTILHDATNDVMT